MIIDPDHMSVARAQPRARADRGRALLRRGLEPQLEHPAELRADLRPGRRRDADLASDTEDFVEDWRKPEQGAQRPLLLRLRLRLRRERPRTRWAARARAAPPTPSVPVQVVRRRRDPRPPANGRAGIRHQHRRHRPLRPVSRTGSRTCARSRATRSSTTWRRGAEAYLQMWERAVGVPRTHCLTPKGAFEPKGFRRVRLGAKPQRRADARRPAAAPQARLALLREGQEEPQGASDGGLHAAGAGRPGEEHRAAAHGARIGRGARVSRLRGVRPMGSGLRVRVASADAARSSSTACAAGGFAS